MCLENNNDDNKLMTMYINNRLLLTLITISSMVSVNQKTIVPKVLAKYIIISPAKSENRQKRKLVLTIVD